MTVSVADGVVEEIVKGRSPPIGNGTIYKRAIWRSPAGETTQLKRLVVDRSMNTHLEAGRSGRFYSAKTLGGRTIFGFRGGTGESLFAWPRGFRTTAIMMIVIGGLSFLVTLFTRNAITFLGVILFFYGIALIISDNKARKAGRVLYDGDAPG